MQQGKTKFNGPHQGAWVDTKTGEDWFIHFQDKDAYGRVVLLEPMQWKNDWPVIGTDKDNDGTGEPVSEFTKPNVGKIYPVTTPQETDEFNESAIGQQWQWQANPKPTWAFVNSSNSSLRLFSYQQPDSAKNLWDIPNILMQKFPAEEFMATAKFSFKPRIDGEQFGLTVFGMDYASIVLTKVDKEMQLSFAVCKNADKGKSEIKNDIVKLTDSVLYFRVKVTKAAICTFSYSNDGKSFTEIKENFVAKPGKWIGAKIGLFCTRTSKTNDSGFADIDWFRVDK